jgi:hypothetical protein
MDISTQEDLQLPDLSQLITSTEYVSKNRLATNALGFVIQDTVNNPFFPIPIPILDKGRGYLHLVFRQYISMYQKQYTNNTLPWHFVVQFDSVQGFYNIHNTRPINLKYPFDNNQLKEIINVNDLDVDDNIMKLLNNPNTDPSEMIHICIIGDTNLDVYTRDIYEKIGEFIISPLSKIYKISPFINDGIFLFNTGDKFKHSMISNYIRRI